jgi:hypothetical protein
MTEPAQSTTPETADQPDEPEQPDRSARRWVPLVLTVVSVLLLAFGATMTVLYVREAGARHRATATAASRAAQLDDLREQLNELQAQRADLQAQLKTAQDKALDPIGYEKIKNCVQTYKLLEATTASLLAGHPGPTASFFIATGKLKPGTLNPTDLKPETICTDAAKYLK